jgi:hypothetical protein
MEAPIPPLLAKIENALRWCRIHQSMASAYWDDATRMVEQWNTEGHRAFAQISDGVSKPGHAS